MDSFYYYAQLVYEKLLHPTPEPSAHTLTSKRIESVGNRGTDDDRSASPESDLNSRNFKIGKMSSLPVERM